MEQQNNNHWGYQMTTKDWLGLIIGFFAVLVPFIIKWQEQKSKLQQSLIFIELLKTKNQLEEAKRVQEQQELSPIIENRLDSLLVDINKEISKSSTKDSTTYFLLFALTEALLFFDSSLFSNIEFNDKIIKREVI